MVYDEEKTQSLDMNASDCCGNGCTNCILDNRPKPSARALQAGKRNVIINYAKFSLLSKERHSATDSSSVLLLHFSYKATNEQDAADSILDIPPGYHVMLRLTEPQLLRPYSPYWVDFAKKEFKIIVKLQPSGPMSKHIAAMQPNDVLEFRGPIGNYVHNAQQAKCIFIIAQGVAVAPTLPLVEQVLNNEDDMSRIHHLVCAKNLQHLYFRERLLEFAKYWNYRSCSYLAHQLCDNAACQQAGSCNMECPQLRASLRYKESVRPQRLNVVELTAYCAAAELPKSGGLEPVLIIAGHASFQKAMSDQAASILCVQHANIFLL